MSDKHKKPVPPPLTPREQRRLNLAHYGTTLTPEPHAVDPALLTAGLNACASAGLPEPTILQEAYGPPEDGTFATIYVFVHIRVPQLQFRAEETVIAAYPERVIQVCKSAGIKTDSLAATDDPEPLAA